MAGVSNFVDSDGNRVNVGNCHNGNVNVNNWNDSGNDNIGLGASRNFLLNLANTSLWGVLLSRFNPTAKLTTNLINNLLQNEILVIV